MAELKEKGSSLNRIINNLDINSPICSCFITAYTNEKTSGLNNPTEKELLDYNIQQNNLLERDLRNLQLTGYKKTIGGYTYGNDNKIKSEPGFVVSANTKNVNAKEFLEEMLALGKKYKQESILIKIPGKKAAYYDTFINHDNIDSEFSKIKKIVPTKHISEYPNNPNAWEYGYTQTNKDFKKNKDQGFSLLDSTLEEMNINSLRLTEEEIATITESSGEHGIPTMNMAIMKVLTRRRLGLSPYFEE